MKRKIRRILIIGGVVLLVFILGISLLNNFLYGNNGKPITKTYLPNSNTTCESLIPKNLTVSLGYTGSAGLSPHGLKWEGYTSNCYPNTQVGQNINQFTCIADKDVKNRVTSDGTILRNYEVRYTFLLDNRNCTKFSSNEYSERSQEFLSCEIIKSACDWAYI